MVVAVVTDLSVVSVVVITSFVAGTSCLVSIKVSGITISTRLMVTSLVVSEDVGAEGRALVDLKTNTMVEVRFTAVTGLLLVAGRTVAPSVVAVTEQVAVGAIDAGRFG
jgi:hypothetical protein